MSYRCAAQLLLIDMPGDMKYFADRREITPDNVRAFVDAYLNNRVRVCARATCVRRFDLCFCCPWPRRFAALVPHGVPRWLLIAVRVRRARSRRR